MAKKVTKSKFVLFWEVGLHPITLFKKEMSRQVASRNAEEKKIIRNYKRYNNEI